MLADLRKLNTEVSSQTKKNGKAALFSPYMNRTGISDLPRAEAQPTIREDVLITGNVHAVEHTHSSRQHKPTPPSRVHFESESHSSDRDIWMSAGSSGDECDIRNEKRAHHHIRQRQIAQPHLQASVLVERPKSEHVPVVPVSKPEAIAKGTTMSPQPHNAGEEAAVLSTSEEAIYSAVSHISNIDGEFVPASRDVQRAFPRGSSVYSTSPSRQSSKRSPQRKVQVWTDGAPETKTVPNPIQRAKLAKMHSNTIVKATPREAAGKKAVAILPRSEDTQRTKALPPLPCLSSDTIPPPSQACDCTKKSCSGCVELGVRVYSLEEEVARLKAEVLGLRSALRKTGVSSRVAERKR